MKAPKDLSKEDKAIWKRLFNNFTPLHEAEIDMARRYLQWSNLFNCESQKVMSGDTRAAHGGKTKKGEGYKTEGQSVALKNMKDAEAEMRRLWKILEPRIAPIQDDSKDAGEYADL